MNNSKNHQSREKWKALVEEHEKSGLTQQEFCRQHNCSFHSFVYYRGLFRERPYQEQKQSGAFAAITVTNTYTTKEVRLILPNKFQCIFPIDVEKGLIKELLEVLILC